MRRLSLATFFLLVLSPLTAGSQTATEWLQKGQEAYQQGDLNAALAAYHKAAKLEPDNVTIRFHLGTIAVVGGALQQAEGAFRAVLSVAPEHAPAHYNLGLLLSDAKRWKEALPHLKKATSLLAADPAPALALATVYIDLNRHKEAGKLLKGIQPQSEHVQSLTVFLRLRQGKHKKAVALAEQALSAQPNSLKLRILHATALIHAGQLERALQLLRVLVRLAPQSLANVPYLLGLTHFIRGNISSARDWYREAVARAPDAFDPRIDLFNPRGFPTAGDIAFMTWASSDRGPPRTAQASILDLAVEGKKCSAAVYMVPLLGAATEFQECLPPQDKIPYTVAVRFGRHRPAVKSKPKGAVAKCLSTAVNQVKPASTLSCRVQFVVRSGR